MAPGGTRAGGGATRHALATWLVDGHAHLHPSFDWEEVLDAVTGNLARAASNGGPPLEAACLLLAEAAVMARSPTMVERLRDPVEAAGLLPPGWRAEPTAEEGSIRLAPEGGGVPIFLVDGRQLVTSEGIEVLALCSRAAHTELEGLPLSETIEGVRAADGVPVLPWGFGKWWGRRGRLVRELVERLGAPAPPPLFLGDNGNRPAGTPPPALMRRGEERGIPVLPGSDPLPFPRHAHRPASAGFRLTGPLDPERPLSSVRWTLRTLTGSPPPVGRGASPLQFVRDQVGMQLRKRRGERGAPTGGAS